MSPLTEACELVAVGLLLQDPRTRAKSAVVTGIRPKGGVFTVFRRQFRAGLTEVNLLVRKVFMAATTTQRQS